MILLNLHLLTSSYPPPHTHTHMSLCILPCLFDLRSEPTTLVISVTAPTQPPGPATPSSGDAAAAPALRPRSDPDVAAALAAAARSHPSLVTALDDRVEKPTQNNSDNSNGNCNALSNY